MPGYVALITFAIGFVSGGATLILLLRHCAQSAC